MKRSAQPPECQVEFGVQRGLVGGPRHAARLVRLAQRFAQVLKLGPVALSLALVSDARIRPLKKRWLGIDAATDVLSFPAGDGPNPFGPRLLGDLVISLETARRVAREQRVPLEQELARYLAHGLLHLLGHDHQTPRDARRMERVERRLLGHAGMLSGSHDLELEHRSSRSVSSPRRPARSRLARPAASHRAPASPPRY